MNIWIATVPDCAAIARLHQVCFPDSFLTRLGARALARYYRFFVEEREGVCFVGEDNNEIVGFVAGWKQGAFYQVPLLKSTGAWMILGGIWSLLTHPITTLRLLVPRLKLIWLLLFAFLRNMSRGAKHETPAQTTQSEEPARPKLNASPLSIAVDPEYRGTPVATDLIGHFVTHCCQHNVPNIVLTVENHNRRAHAFYRKCG